MYLIRVNYSTCKRLQHMFKPAVILISRYINLWRRIILKIKALLVTLQSYQIGCFYFVNTIENNK